MPKRNYNPPEETLNFSPKEPDPAAIEAAWKALDAALARLRAFRVDVSTATVEVMGYYVPARPLSLARIGQ